ncbi:MFS transporter [Roseateles asaccharophilus]|uniref:MFS family permease n=1 Tax=Roseateles asaccharophilus TaxID=582607 RepID=A0ABU2A4K3_9BURK|nr:MFS transporter [Roseateles asaccharophilus]MDR7332134.1 MFS family permease [Roseateles asaccharophilus]
MSTPEPLVAATPKLREQRDYLRLLAARVSGGAANQMLMVALGWQMYDLTGSAWDLGLVGLAQFLPALLLTLPAGHLVDQRDRRLLLAASLTLQSVVAAVLALGSAGAWVGSGLILSLSVLLGMARALQMPAQQALMPSLVPAVLLPRAVAAASSTMQTAIIGGPALGGALYALGPWLSRQLGHTAAPTAADAAHWGAAGVYTVSLLMLAASIVAVLGIAPRAVAARRAAPGWTEVTAGLRFIWQRPVVLGAISLDLFAVLLGGATALLPIFAKDILHTGPEGLGLLRAAPAAGALVVGLWLARHPIARRAGRWLLGAVGVFGLAMIGFALTTSFWVAFAVLAISGAADMVSVVIRQSLVQLETPDEMRGRVGAVNSVFIGASNQLGEFESGATAALLGPVGSVLLGGFGVLAVVALWFRLFPDLARRDSVHPRP